MIKRCAVLSVLAVFVFALAGCSSNASSTAAPASSAAASAEASASASSSTTSLFAEQQWPETHVTENVPKPSFSQPISSLKTSDQQVIATWEGLTDSEVEQYVTAVKAAGFDKDVNETKSATEYSLLAYDTENPLDGSTVIINYKAAKDNKPSSFQLTVQRMH